LYSTTKNNIVSVSFFKKKTTKKTKICCDIAVIQINYLSLSKQDSIDQARGKFHEEGLVQIFMLYDMQWGGF
jgi:hypothetical protein